MKLYSSDQLNWEAARVAAERILRDIGDAGFAAPEDVSSHHRYVAKIAEQMGALAAALLISPSGGKP